jgi:hypothetical protein
MTYEELKEMDQRDAICKVMSRSEIDDKLTRNFPLFADIIIFGNEYWKSNELIVDFINEYLDPKSENDLSKFFTEIVYRIASDPCLDDTTMRKQIHVNYRLMYKSYLRMFSHPDSLNDWAEQKATFLWYEFILAKKRIDKFRAIVKRLEPEKLSTISKQVQDVYSLTDNEIIYLQYFCSQTKLDDLDASLNTFLYIWSNEKFTGKTTVSEYICSFLNGEEEKNAEDHKSDLATEMQMGRFDMPSAITSRCTLLDEAGFKDMSKTYDKLKSMVTSNSCNIEYKYKNSKRPKRCYRNYIMSSNHDPIYFVKDDDERRMLAIHFTKTKKMAFDDLERMWYEFVLQCNYDKDQLSEIYHTIIKPNSQKGESADVKIELYDVFSDERIWKCSELSYFSVTNVMMFPEVIHLKLPRKLIKEVIIKLYGEPDVNQRFYKSKRNKELATVELENIKQVFSDNNFALPF